MSLMKCPECGKEVSDSAKNCPSCGFCIDDYILQLKEAERKEQEEARKQKKREEDIEKSKEYIIQFENEAILKACDLAKSQFKAGMIASILMLCISIPFLFVAFDGLLRARNFGGVGGFLLFVLIIILFILSISLLFISINEIKNKRRIQESPDYAIEYYASKVKSGEKYKVAKKKVEDYDGFVKAREEEARKRSAEFDRKYKVKCPVCGSITVHKIGTFERSVSVAAVGLVY